MTSARAVADLDALLGELEGHPGAILAWEVDEPTHPCLSVFHVEGGTRQVAYLGVPRAERAAVTAALARLGQVSGWYASATGLVWRAHDRAFTVWGEHGPAFHTDGQTLELAQQRVPFAATMQVVAFLAEDYVERGVRLRADAGEHTVASHRLLRPAVDWSYGALDALADSGWTLYLGRDLADFLGVPLVDETG